jgi:hypothetical protein
MATTAVDPVFVDTSLLIYAHQALSRFGSVLLTRAARLLGRRVGLPSCGASPNAMSA